MFGNKMYGYNKRFLKIFGLNAFPLIGWTIGLFITSILFNIIRIYMSITIAIITTIILYWILLLIAEYVGYNVFSIHNEAAAKYGGLFGLKFFHAPNWMRTVYFSLGPIIIILVAIIPY